VKRSKSRSKKEDRGKTRRIEGRQGKRRNEKIRGKSEKSE